MSTLIAAALPASERRAREAIARAQEAAGASGLMLDPHCWDALAAHLAERLDFVYRHTARGAADRAPLPMNDGTHPSSGQREGSAREELLHRVSMHWSAACTELVCRLESDLPQIAADLNHGCHPGRVVAIQPGLGDSHHEGRVTTKLAFANGLSIVYKPRSVGLLRAWNLLVKALEGGTGLEGFCLPPVLDRGTHGWVRWIDRQPCSNEGEQRRLLQRFGMVTAIAYVLGATDLHADNLIAHQDSPVLLDGESLLWIEWHRPPSVDQVRCEAYEMLARDSVLRTGVLPQWRMKGGAVVDGSALGWLIARSGGGRDIESYMRGLRVGYEAIAAPHGRRCIARFLRSVEREPSRAILRPTTLYYQALLRMLASVHEAGGDAGDRVMSDRLLQTMEASEREALAQLDIPRFAVNPPARTTLDARFDGARSRAWYVWRRLSRLSEVDLKRQLQLARAAIAIYCSGRAHRKRVGRYGADAEGASVDEGVSRGGTSSSEKRVPHSLVLPSRVRSDNNASEIGGRGQTAADVDETLLVETAERIGWEVIRGAIETPRGLLWVTQRPVGGAHWWRLEPADFGLYDGNTGVALFMAALGRVTHDPRWMRIAEAAMRPVVEAVSYDGHGPDFVGRFGVGGAEGLGGVLFGTARFASVSGCKSELNAMLPAVEAVRPAGDGASSELLYGRAGWIAGLLAAHKGTGKEWLMERAETDARRVAMESAPLLRDPSRVDPSRTGYGHGLFGVAAALASVYAHRADDLLGEVASGLLALACQMVPTSSRGASSDDRSSSWCTGAAGTVLALLAGEAIRVPVNHVAPRVDVQIEVESHLNRALHAPIQTEMSVCCGLAGRLDALLECAQEEPKRSEVLKMVHGGARDLARRVWLQRLPGRLSSAERWPFASGLYSGLSGIGYALLRVAAPETLPSITRWF